MDQFENCPEVEPRRENSPPNAQDAARRLVILKYVVVRALAAPPRDIWHEYLQQWPADGREKLTKDLERENDKYWQGLRDEGLWKHLSPWEQKYAAGTVITMTHEDQVDASWRVESAQTLMWALGLLSALPPYDDMADHDLLKMIPSHDVAGFIGSAGLRPQAEIDRARDIAELWHWRGRERELFELGDELPPDEKLKALGFHSHDDIIRFTARMEAELGMIPPCIGDDFPAHGRAYRELTDHEWRQVGSIAVQRHFALNWLCGYAPGNRWDETRTDT